MRCQLVTQLRTELGRKIRAIVEAMNEKLKHVQPLAATNQETSKPATTNPAAEIPMAIQLGIDHATSIQTLNEAPHASAPPAIPTQVATIYLKLRGNSAKRIAQTIAQIKRCNMYYNVPPFIRIFHSWFVKTYISSRDPRELLSWST